MAVRKIPLVRRPLLLVDGSTSDDTEKPEDPEVQVTMSKIREIVLEDRALYDKVSGTEPAS